MHVFPIILLGSRRVNTVFLRRVQLLGNMRVNKVFNARGSFVTFQVNSTRKYSNCLCPIV